MASLRCANPVHTAAAARTFLTLARSAASRTPSPGPLLDILLPRMNAVAAPSSRWPVTTRLRPRVRASEQLRPFSGTTSRRQTRCVYNPQTNDEGEEMRLEITARAAKRLSEIMKKDDNPNLALRIQVESGGCHGFQYLMSLVTLPDVGTDGNGGDPSAWSAVAGEEDAVLQFLPDEDASPDATKSLEGAKVIIDRPSLELLQGSKVDYTMELIGSQFKIVDNPFASSSCGCGTSFDIKI